MKKDLIFSGSNSSSKQVRKTRVILRNSLANKKIMMAQLLSQSTLFRMLLLLLLWIEGHSLKAAKNTLRIDWGYLAVRCI